MRAQRPTSSAHRLPAATSLPDIETRVPTPCDGAAVHRLIAQCPPLDVNSLYCNLLQCSHFAATSIVALREGVPVGFVSGYLLPRHAGSLFVWQVAVSSQVRGTGLGGRMLDELLTRPACTGVRFLHTSITDANAASWALFRAFARRRGARLRQNTLFDRDLHLAGHADSERLASIGPIRVPARRAEQPGGR